MPEEQKLPEGATLLPDNKHFQRADERYRGKKENKKEEKPKQG